MIQQRTTSFGARTADTATELTAEQCFFLDRLAHLTRRAALLERYLIPTDRRMRLLGHAIFATYEDCIAVGVRADARALLDRAGR